MGAMIDYFLRTAFKKKRAATSEEVGSETGSCSSVTLNRSRSNGGISNPGLTSNMIESSFAACNEWQCLEVSISSGRGALKRDTSTGGLSSGGALSGGALSGGASSILASWLDAAAGSSGSGEAELLAS